VDVQGKSAKNKKKEKFLAIPTWSKKYFSFARDNFPGEFLRFLRTFPGE
jgi:hypothetical protein